MIQLFTRRIRGIFEKICVILRVAFIFWEEKMHYTDGYQSVSDFLLQFITRNGDKHVKIHDMAKTIEIFKSYHDIYLVQCLF